MAKRLNLSPTIVNQTVNNRGTTSPKNQIKILSHISKELGYKNYKEMYEDLDENPPSLKRTDTKYIKAKLSAANMDVLSISRLFNTYAYTVYKAINNINPYSCKLTSMIQRYIALQLGNTCWFELWQENQAFLENVKRIKRLTQQESDYLTRSK